MNIQEILQVFEFLAKHPECITEIRTDAVFSICATVKGVVFQIIVRLHEHDVVIGFENGTNTIVEYTSDEVLLACSKVDEAVTKWSINQLKLVCSDENTSNTASDNWSN